LTREDTKDETQNVLNYLDAITNAELQNQPKNLILFGFSQGVSVVMRWMATRKIHCDQVILYAGGIPKELKPEDFAFAENTRFKIVYGLQDEYLTEKSIKDEKQRAKWLFGNQLEIIPFEGKHQLKPDLICSLVGE
jgi:predicted esterase